MRRGPFQWRRTCAAGVRGTLHIWLVMFYLENTVLAASDQLPDKACQKRCTLITYVNRSSVESGYSVFSVAGIEKFNVEITDVLLSGR